MALISYLHAILKYSSSWSGFRSGRSAWAQLAAIALLLLSAAGASPALAQTSGRPAKLDGPLFWCDGITQVDDFDAYAASGFNTIVVRLYWVPAADGSISANEIRPQRAFATLAARRGFKVIYALPPAPVEATGLRISPESEVYMALWTTWIQGAIRSLKDTPGLIGWMLPDDPRGQHIFDDLGFQRWIGRNYANVTVVNKQWGAVFRSFDDISIPDVAALVAQKKGLAPNQNVTSEAELQARLAASKIPNQPGFAFPPAALALAQYKLEAYSGLLSRWAQAVKGADPGRLLFSGRLPDYAQLLAMPPEVDVIVPDLAPQGTENDLVTHNPQAIDIARRGGRFKAIPVFTPEPSPSLPASAFVDLVPRWLQAAWARGASGAAFHSWQQLKNAPSLLKTIGLTAGYLSLGQQAQVWGNAPINTAAVVLTPLAEGTMVQHGEPPLQFPRGLYGFGEDLVSGEPSDLVWALRWGTAYGGVDYLAPDDVLDLSLERYTTLFMPQAFSVTNEMTARLGEYAANGGTVVADLGIGALQNGAQANGFSPLIGNLFGVPNLMDLKPVPFNLAGLAIHGLFPSWTKAAETRAGVPLTQGDGPDGAAFYGPVGYSFVPPRAVPLARAPDIAQDFTLTKRVWRAQLTVNEVRRGYAVFAPFRLWTNWRPEHPGFDTFHGDLLGRGALVAVAGATTLVPLPRPRNDGYTLFPEVINHAGGLILTNHSAPKLAPLLTAIQTPGTGDWLWSGGICYLPNVQDATLPPAHPAPIADASEYESRTRPFMLYARLESAESTYAAMRPIMVQNTAGGPVAARIVEEDINKLVLNVWPNSSMVLKRDYDWQPSLGEANPARVTVISSGTGYEFGPATQHKVRITDYAKGTDKKGRYYTDEKLVTAGDDGRLTIDFTGVACAIEVTPSTSGGITASAQKR